MKRVLGVCIFFLLSFVALSCASTSKVSLNTRDISPYDFGLRTAKTGEERYRVLVNAHQAAVSAGVNVDYTGIDTLRLEIPKEATSIPLTRYNDFQGCVFIIKNTSKNCWLFRKKTKGIHVDVDKQSIDAGMFTSYNSLRTGRCLLLIEDEKPWVLNRKGHDYGHQRKDILLIENGKAKNRVVMPYDNENSSPKCTFIRLPNEPLVIKNLFIKRDTMCSFVTHIAYISGFDDVRITNVAVHTPKSELQNDRGFRIYDCINVTMDNVRIDGTYSQKDHSGYGINLGNVWNFKAKHLYGKANWGIFGNNNVNVSRIEDSQINRFDIHCYGRDISFKNVDFFDLYNQYSSVYGTILYDHCTFTNFTPVLNGGSYNAYVGHEVMINDCVMNVTTKKNCVFDMRHLLGDANVRKELSERSFPNVSIHNLVVNMTEGADDFYLFYCKTFGMSVSSIGYLSIINIDGLTINSDGDKPVKEMMLSNVPIKTKLPVDCQMTNIKVNQPVKKMQFSRGKPNMQLVTNIPLKGGKVILRNTTGIKD